jgi:MFS family permease
MQGIVLASFFYGYVTTQLPGGMLAERFGGKRLLLFGIFWTSVLTILTPPLTRVGGFAAIVAVRVLEGIGEVRRGALLLADYL